jgi:BA14K-like protein
MEPMMFSVRVSSTAAVMALALAMAAPSTSFAQATAHGGVHVGGGVHGGGARFGGGRGWHGGGGGWHGDRGRGGFIPGAVAGALIGGAIASQGYGYYGAPGYYYAPGSYYDDQYYDDGAAAPAPAGDDAVTYCMQTYRSYDPASGTYQGFDGLRHPCP